MRLLVVLLCALLLFTACTSPKIPGGVQQAAGITTLDSQPTVLNPAEQSGSVETKVTNAGSQAIELVTFSEEDSKLWGRPVDPQSLLELPEYQELDFGHHYTHVISPDGRTMALLTWPNGMDNRGGKLQIVDLLTWTNHFTDVTFDTFVGTLLFSADGKKLYWNEPTRTDPAHGMPRDYILYRYDLDSQVRTEVIKLPPSFEPWEMHLLDPGSRLAIYGLPTTPDNLAEDVPHVLLIDLDVGRTAADVRLEGIKAGQMRVDPDGVDGSPYRMYRPGLAWDLMHSLLYVVHADDDSVTVVDLAKGEVSQQAEVHRQAEESLAQSLLERLLSRLATPAQAKAVPGTEKWATLDIEENRLYVVGLHSQMERKQDTQELTWNQVPLGLQVIATDDLTELQRLDLAVNNLALSPDGKWLLLTGAYDVTGADGQPERAASGLYLVDAHTLQVANHLLPESEVYLHGFSADGRYGYVSTADSERLGDHLGNWHVKLHMLEMESGKFVAEREFPGNFLDLLP